MPTALRPQHALALQTLSATLDDTLAEWLLAGSTGRRLAGWNVEPDDIDVEVSPHGIEAASRALNLRLRDDDIGPGRSLRAEGRISGVAIDLTANTSGVIYAAWTENRDPNTRFVYVKRHDGTGWTQLGGPLNDFADGGYGNGANPVIHLMAGDVFVAYQDFAGTNYQIFVKRWNGTAWDQVGAEMNTDVTANAYEPDMTSIGRVLYVSFLEEQSLSDL